MFAADTVRQEIEARNQEFMAAFKRGDAAGVASGYADDALVMPPGGQAVTGKQAIERFWRSVMDAGVREVELRTERAEAQGDLAYEIGSASLRIRPEGGTETIDTVKYVVVWTRRAGGPWQLAVDIWNSNSGG